jgi:hypothetical protein
MGARKKTSKKPPGAPSPNGTTVQGMTPRHNRTEAPRQEPPDPWSRKLTPEEKLFLTEFYLAVDPSLDRFLVEEALSSVTIYVQWVSARPEVILAMRNGNPAITLGPNQYYQAFPGPNAATTIYLLGHESWHTLQVAQIGSTLLMESAYGAHSAWRWLVGKNVHGENIYEITAWAIAETIKDKDVARLFEDFKAGRIKKLSEADKKKIREKFQQKLLERYVQMYGPP